MSQAAAAGRTGLTSPANLLTIGRIAASPVLFALILAAEPHRGTSWVVFAVGWILGLSDVYDGRMARSSGQASSLGAFLDPLADKIVVLGAAWCFVWVDRFFWVPVMLITARELIVSLARMRWAVEGLSLPARLSAKYKTLVQGVALALAALPPLEQHGWAPTAMLWVAVSITLWSGWQYLRDGQAGAVAN